MDKRIFVVSDTHQLLYGLETALYKEAGNFEYVIHLGDLEGDDLAVRMMLDRIDPLIAFAAVRGNCDDDLSVPESRVISFNDTRLFLAHGHRHINKVPGDPFDALASAALGNDCQIALFGHTHHPYYGTAFNGVVLINPGSISLPRQLGRHPAYGILTIGEGGAFSWEQKYL
ncbi:MAG: YfcE family phosphodiesterase [Lachnospiraceae bacterium]|nr:YfcE family phosphodiesterase [Lachnospiraceae bacterium]